MNAARRPVSITMMFIATLSLLMGLGVRSAAAAGPPIGGCPPGFNKVTVQFILENTSLTEPDPSMDGNGDGLTCLKLLPTGPDGATTRATWHDNVLKNE